MSSTRQISSSWLSLLASGPIFTQTMSSFMDAVAHLPQSTCRPKSSRQSTPSMPGCHQIVSHSTLGRRSSYGLVHGMVLPNVTRINFPINLLHWSNLPPSRISASHSTRNSPWRTMSRSCASHAISSCAKFVRFGTHCRHPPFVPWCTPLSVHASTSQTASSTGRARIFSIVFSRSWTPRRVWFWSSGNTTRSQPQSDATFTGCQSKLVYVSRWTSSQEIVLWVKLQSTWPSSAVPSTKSRRGATYDWRHKFSSWSLGFVRSVPVDVVSPSHPHNCGIYFQSTFELYTRSLICSERDWKLISCSSPSFTTEDLCHQCDIYYYY